MEGGNDEETSNAFTGSSVDGPINLELQPDYQDVFHIMKLFDSREDLIKWVCARALPLGIVIIVSYYETVNERRLPRLMLSCERSGHYRAPKKTIQVNGLYMLFVVITTIHWHSTWKALQKSFSQNRLTIKTIYNIRHKHRYLEHAGRSQMQYLLGKLEEHGYYQYTRRCQQTDTIKDLFYAHPMSMQLLRAFPNVLLMDCTYKTNRYRLPLFEIVGITLTNMTFSIACAYLESEKEDNYTWALTVLKGLMDQRNLLNVIITDREIALINAIQTTFPNSHHFLCRWHINKNIAANCKKFRTKDKWDSFLSAWNMIVLADTEDRYTELLSRFQADYSAHLDVVKYVMSHWIKPYKERFINCWTNNVMHFDNTTTCRAEGAHAKLKKFLGTNTGNLETCWEKMHDLLETSFNAIKASFEKSVNVVQHIYKSPVFQFLRGVVSIVALDKVLEEMKSVGEYGVDPLLCGCVMRTKCGLPCAHEIDEHIRSSEPICIDKVDRFWRKLDMEPLKIMNPSTTLLVELEVQYKTRGRPKKTKSKADTSTKREKSAFEYVDSVKDSCSPIEEAFLFEVHPPSSAMFSTKQPQKQKVVRRKRTEDIPPTSYIDQIPCTYQPYVEKIEDVKADGHCGFRVIAGLLFGNEDSWSRVRCDNLYELRKNNEEWKRCHVIASTYNVILVTLGGRYPATFLPLFSAPPTTPRIITMALVKYGESKCLNHFVRIVEKVICSNEQYICIYGYTLFTSEILQQNDVGFGGGLEQFIDCKMRFAIGLEMVLGQIAEWMCRSRNRFAITPGLVAVQLDLLLKVHGLEQAEKYFNGLEDSLVDFPVYVALMNCYAEAKYLVKAEATMNCIKKLGCWTTLPYNIMLRLYSQERKHEKLNALVQEMQIEGIVYDKITYKILLQAYARSDLEQMERLLVKMESDCRVIVDYHSYAAAAKGYLKAGALDKAFVFLKKAESMIGEVHGRISAYLSLITYYATMQRKEDVYRIWNLLPSIAELRNNAYVAMISSLVKLDDLDGARNVLEEWEGTTEPFDIQIPNLVIRAYCKKGDVGAAEIVLKELVDNGKEPNAHTLSHMALGYFKNGRMEKAVEVKKKAIVANLAGWKPNLIVVVACLEYLQSKGDTYGIQEMLMLLEKYGSSLGVEEIRGRFWKPTAAINDYYIPYFTSPEYSRADPPLTI
ncbi:hypothetical protein C2S51_004593 [Perilla frutescens var. frutescens]|nr:hypothetical protein C2S51_004593 [Perilla frutescens var. frutescens]